MQYFPDSCFTVLNYVCKSFRPFSAQRFVDTKKSWKMPLTTQTIVL